MQCWDRPGSRSCGTPAAFACPVTRTTPTSPCPMPQHPVLPSSRPLPHAWGRGFTCLLLASPRLAPPHLVASRQPPPRPTHQLPLEGTGHLCAPVSPALAGLHMELKSSPGWGTTWGTGTGQVKLPRGATHTGLRGAGAGRHPQCREETLRKRAGRRGWGAGGRAWHEVPGRTKRDCAGPLPREPGRGGGLRSLAGCLRSPGHRVCSTHGGTDA